jgi:hypothetical protein
VILRRSGNVDMEALEKLIKEALHPKMETEDVSG